MLVETTIKLPCKASELEDAIRRICEPKGIYDKATVKAGIMYERDSYRENVYLKIALEDKDE